MSQAQAFVVAMSVILNNGCTNAVEDPPRFKITTKRDSDNAEVNIQHGKAIFLFHSPFGISHATIERLDANWPDAVVLQLQLKGLENFKVSNGTVTLEAAVSSQEANVRQWKDGKEDSPLDAESSYWMEIRMVGKDGKPVKSIPQEDGSFEIHLSKAFFEDNPKSITVNWIDFYR